MLEKVSTIFSMEELFNQPLTGIQGIAVATFILFLIWIVWGAISTPGNLPPGPRGFPIIGYLPFISRKPHVVFNELAKQYGHVFSLFIGSRRVIVLNSYEAINKALVKQGEIFHGRVKADSIKDENSSIFQSEGELWKEHRRFSLATLRDFGIGKLRLEPRIMEEIHFMLDEIQTYNGKPTDIGDLLRMSVSDVICSIIFGKRFEYTDKDFIYLLNALNTFMKDTRVLNLYMVIPYLLQIPGVAASLGYGDPPMKQRQILLDFISKKIDERVHEHQSGNEDDFIACWLTEREKASIEKGKYFTDSHLTRMVFALFSAGSDTTSNTLRWGLLYLMKYHEVQKKVQEEIDNVIGHERVPSVTDQDQMPYTQATLMEIQRIASLVPSPLHCNIQDTTLLGFFIPKRSVIVPNLWAVHHDPQSYPEPFEFKPERYLDDKGKVVRDEKLIPFGLGKRQCLGEALAKAELFLYFVSMLQRFTFLQPGLHRNEEVSFDYYMGAVSIPKPYSLRAILRKQHAKH